MAGLSDCGGGKITVFKALCPNAKEYPLETQKKALAEMRAVRAQIPTVRMMIRDYDRLMAAAGECVQDQEAAMRAEAARKAKR